MTRSPLVSIVVPVKNAGRELPFLLFELDRFFEKKEYVVEILVCDDGSSDNTPEIVERLSRQIKNLKLLSYETSQGLGTAARRGLLVAQGKWVILFLSLERQAVSLIDQFDFDTDQGGGVVMGRTGLSYELKIQSALRHLGWKVVNFFVRQVLGRAPGWYFPNLILFPRTIGERLAHAYRVSGAGFGVELIALSQKSGYVVREVKGPDEILAPPLPSLWGLQSLRDSLKIRWRLLTKKYENTPIVEF